MPVNSILEQMSKMDLWDTNVSKITKALSDGLGAQGYAITVKSNSKFHVEYIEGMEREKFKRQIKKTERFLNFNIEIGNNSYRIYILQKKTTKLTDQQKFAIEVLLSLISMALTMRQVSKERITETQIINQLNLNITTSLDENKIAKNLQSAARLMLKKNDILIYYCRNDSLIGSDSVFKISELPKSIYNNLFKIQHIFTVLKKNIRLLKKIIPLNNSTDITFVPFSIKNELRGFFVLSGTTDELSENFILTRIKFLANQAGLALERIDLFRKMNSALRESRGLQNLIKVMISSLDLESLSNEILQRAQEFLGFRRILFSIYDPETECFRRITGVGISKKKLTEAKKVKPPLNAISELLVNRFRISNSFYIPATEALKIGKHVRKYELYKSTPLNNRIPDLWDPGDIFLSPIYSKDRELVALLSLDMPMSNLVPTLNKVKLLETFGDFLGMALENAQLFKKIEKLSTTDEMTGVHNYRFLREKFKYLVKEKIKPISLIMIDLDNFKECNDSFGHLHGDEILRIFSECLVDAIRNKGYVVRYGGDEFIILLPRINQKTCKTLIKRIEGHSYKPDICRLHRTCGFSCGIAVYPKNGLNLGALIDYADKLLYQQKSEKHNEH